MAIGLLNKLIFGAKRIALYLKEKPELNIDDCVLEHILYYHGLTGTSPQSNKETRIVKADIKEALERRNRTELALALKLPPALWEERLQNIACSLSDDDQYLLISLLLPPEGDDSEAAEKVCSLNHQDWQVRANAANILSFLKAEKAVKDLIVALNSDTSGNTMAFCYIAYALGKLGGEEAQQALYEHIENNEAWLRVDIGGALAYFDFDLVKDSLTKSLLQEQEALDYLAYAIARKQQANKFLEADSLEINKAGAQLISGLMQAVQNGFSNDQFIEGQITTCSPLLAALAEKTLDPLLVEVMLSINDWLIGQMPSLKESLKPLFTDVNNDNFRKSIFINLEKATKNIASVPSAELSSLIKLSGRLNLVESQPLLIMLLSDYREQLKPNQIDNIITALGQISDEESTTAAVLVGCAQELFNIDERRSLPKSKQPILEENSAQAKIYWQILKALSNLSSPISLEFLFQALNDYAPDKRSCALTSLMVNYQKHPSIKLPRPLDDILKEALNDPAPMMQLAALDSIKALNQSSLIEHMVPLIDARENTVSKHALATLAALANNGHAAKVKAALNDKIKNIREEHTKKRILDILQENS